MIRILLSYLPPCLLHATTGLYCPGCGGTRAFLALLDGHIIQSMYYHPLVVYAVVCFLWEGIRVFLKKISKGKVKWLAPPVKFLTTMGGILMVVNCLVRNLLYLGWGISL